MNLHQSPGFLINKLAHIMQMELEHRLQEYGVTTSQWAILALLWKKEGLSQVEIQQMLGLEKATVTGLVQRMSRAHFVYKATDAHDKRINRVFLTEKGRQLEELLVPHAKSVNELALKGFSHEETERFIEFIMKAIRNVDNEF